MIRFPQGIVGFGGPRRFRLTPWGGDGSPFSLLSSIDEPDLAFVVVPPAVFFADYEPEISDADVEALDLAGPEDALLLVIVTVPDTVRDATANLLGPLVVNTATNVGIQAVLAPERWPARRPLVATATAAA